MLAKLYGAELGYAVGTTRGSTWLRSETDSSLKLKILTIRNFTFYFIDTSAS